MGHWSQLGLLRDSEAGDLRDLAVSAQHCPRKSERPLLVPMRRSKSIATALFQPRELSGRWDPVRSTSRLTGKTVALFSPSALLAGRAAIS